MIRIFHDKTGREDGYPILAMPLLEPLLAPERIKDPAKSPNPSWLSHYELCDDPGQADVFILVGDFEYYKRQNEMNVVAGLLDLGTKYNKPVWIFSGGDYGITPQDTTLNVLRLGGHASTNAGNQFVMPPFIIDPIKYAGIGIEDWQPISWKEVPAVGFCGLADEGITRQIIDNVRNANNYIAKLMGRSPFDPQPFFSTTALRGNVLTKFEATSGIKTEFIKRKKYKAGVTTAEAAAKVKQEYYQNIYDNPYTVCLRGAGNYSIRFYDCLASGRIPAYLDTDSILPLPNIIDWSKHCLVIERSDISTLGKKFLAFHQNVRNEKFVAIQQSNRKLWERYLTFEGFFQHFHLLAPNMSFAHLY